MNHLLEMEHEAENNSWTMDAMEMHGGSFVKCLGALARRADPINLKLIKETWSEYWRQYEQIGQDMRREHDSGAS